MSGFMIPRDPRGKVATGDLIAREGRAVSLAGAAYAVTSQAATDALNPFLSGGALIAANEGQPVEVASVSYALGKVVRVISAGAVVAGERVRPAYNADAALNDRFAGVGATALPVGAGTYWTWGRALTAASGAGAIVEVCIFPEETIVVGG